MGNGGHDDGRGPGGGAWPFGNLFPFPLQPFGFGFPPNMMPGMAMPGMPGMSGMPGMGPMAAMFAPRMPTPGMPFPGMPFPGMPAPEAPAASTGAAPTAIPPMQLAQQMTRANLEVVALISRRTRALMEAPQRFSQCRSFEDMTHAQAAFLNDMLTDFTTANQRILAIWMGVAVPGQQPPPAPAPAAASPQDRPEPAAAPAPVSAAPLARAPAARRQAGATTRKPKRPTPAVKPPRATSARKAAPPAKPSRNSKPRSGKAKPSRR